MTTKFKFYFTGSFAILLILFLITNTFAQGTLNKVKYNTESNVNPGTKTLVRINNVKNSININSSKNSNQYSILDDRYPLTKDIFVHIEGEYPRGYEPNWRLVGKTAALEIKTEDYTYARPVTKSASINFGIVEYEGKTVVKQNTFCGCDCVADIDLESNIVTLDDVPKKFTLKNFRQIPKNSQADPNTSCYTSRWAQNPQGYIMLSADNVGNIIFDYKLEVFDTKNKLSKIAFGNRLSMPNLMTPDAANEVVATAIKNDNRIKKEAIENENYVKQREYLDRQYQQSLKIIKSKPTATTSIVATYKGYTLKKTIDLEKLVANNIKKNDGVAEAYEIAKSGYYYLIGSFNYTFNAKNFEPHERDTEFALRYCLAKTVNNFAIEIATYALVGDKEKLIEIGERLLGVKNTSQIVDNTEQNSVLGYLKSK